MHVIHLSVHVWPGLAAFVSPTLPGRHPLGAAQNQSGQHDKKIATITTLLVKGDRVFQEAQTNTLPKAEELPGNVSFRHDRLGCQSPKCPAACIPTCSDWEKTARSGWVHANSPLRASTQPTAAAALELWPHQDGAEVTEVSRSWAACLLQTWNQYQGRPRMD